MGVEERITTRVGGFKDIVPALGTLKDDKPGTYKWNLRTRVALVTEGGHSL